MIKFSPNILMIGGRAKRLWNRCVGPKDCIIPRSVIARYLPEDPVVVEAGAADGQDTVLSAKFWARSQIYAFEPVPQLYECLTTATAALPQVHAMNLGLYDRRGTVQMHLSDNGFGSSSVLKPTGHLDFHPGVRFDQSINIAVTTLNEWFASAAIPAVDFLWLDMQGAELAAMKHADAVLDHACAIHTEVSLQPTYEGAPLYPEVREWLAARGFSVVRTALPYPDMGNVLFANSANLSRRKAGHAARR